MEPALEKISTSFFSSISVKREITSYMDYPWHYHPEFEIILVEKSYGLRFMGNHIGNFRDGDLVFISPNLPHVWRNDQDFYKRKKGLYVDVYVIHFKENALSSGFFNLPEMEKIKSLFKKGQQGMLVHEGEKHDKLSHLIKSVASTDGLDRLILFLQTLLVFSEIEGYSLLSSPGYNGSVNMVDEERINTIINFITQNYSENIELDNIATLANMTKTSFCRYFKSKTHKTYTQFLNEIRILNACKYLIHNNMSIQEACYSSGYNNISYFNRQFKLITGYSAKIYTKKFGYI